MTEKRSTRLPQRSVDSDGNISDNIMDILCEQSIYIPPGDVRREAYRLFTFKQFSVTCPIIWKSLAKSGFYFTGFCDRVKCFACARTVERWEKTDNPAELKWHEINCSFSTGEESGNVSLPSLFQSTAAAVPSAASSSAQGEQILEQRDANTGSVIRRVRYPDDLPERIRQTGRTFEIGPNKQVTIRSRFGPARRNPAHVRQAQHQPGRQWRMADVISADHKRFLTNLFLNRELHRLLSFARWPTGRPNIAPAYLAQNGFFYLGNMDRTQCFSCGGVLMNWCSEDYAEVEHRTHFPLCRMVVGSELHNIPVRENPETEEERERKYPLRFPANPRMRTELARLGTFDRRWPIGKTAATPAEISQAGFFFLGERDRSKCWYCNGSLLDWEYGDIPWIEHAKWFPNCQFLLRVKGQNFVYRHLAMNLHLPRPIISRQDDFPLKVVDQYQPIVASTPPPVVVYDPQEEKRRVENIMQNSDVVKPIVDMGYREIVADLLEDRICSQNEANPDDVYESSIELLNAVFKVQEDREEEEQGKLGPNKLYIQDEQRRKSFLIDTGSWTCVIPATSFEKLNCRRGPDSVAANGSKIATYGKKRVFLKLSNGKPYPYDFFIADVKERIIGADFIRHYKLVINLRDNRLEDPDGSHICGTLQSVTASVNLSCIEIAGGDPQDEWDEEEELPFLELSSICSLLSKDMRRRKERVENMMKNSENVKVILAMGFDAKIVTALLEDKIDSGNVTDPNHIYESVSELLDDVAEKEEELKNEEEERRNQASTPQPSLTGPNSMRTMSSMTATKRLLGAEGNRESLQEALNKIEEERMCKICFTNQADMVFKPCAHMCCCIECTQAITQCPVCRKKIEQAIKTYLK